MTKKQNKTQYQMYYEEQKKLGIINEHFINLVRENDITSDELEKLIKKNPAIWGRFSDWVNILLSE